MSNKGITKEQVLAIANELLAQNGKVSISEIRNRLGTGSFSTISGFLKQAGISSVKSPVLVTREQLGGDLLGSQAVGIIRDTRDLISNALHESSVLKKYQQTLKDEDVNLVCNLVINDLLVQIISMHASSNSPLKFFCNEVSAKKLLSISNDDYSSKLIDDMQKDILDELFAFINSIMSNPERVEHYVGRFESLTAIQRMLSDYKNRNMNQNAKAYRYWYWWRYF